MAQEPRTVVGTGVAVSRSSTGLVQPRVVASHPGEDAMTNELKKIQAETDAIAARSDLDDAEKTRQIQALNEPSAMRARMHRARDIATGKIKA